MDDEAKYIITSTGTGTSSRRWFPGCGVPGCPAPPVNGLLLTQERLGHVHACPRHTLAVLMHNRVARVFPLGARNWAGWCAQCELVQTDRWTARWW